jgi:hypothetical protein
VALGLVALVILLYTVLSKVMPMEETVQEPVQQPIQERWIRREVFSMEQAKKVELIDRRR